LVLFPGDSIFWNIMVRIIGDLYNDSRINIGFTRENVYK
jgi:hypothetical protein